MTPFLISIYRPSCVLLFLLALGGCDEKVDVTGPTISVFAAASLGDVLDDVNSSCKTSVLLTRGPSGLLCTQVRKGAPADVIITADREYLSGLLKDGLVLQDSVQVLARNRLVLVVNKGHNRAGKPANLSLLREADVRRVAIGNPSHVPAGAYAMQALRRAGLENELTPKLVYAEDVRMASRYIVTSMVDAAIIYQTDARAFASDLHTVFVIPDDQHAPIEYVGAVCSRSSARETAGTYLALLCGSEASEIWRRHGFTLASDTPVTRPTTP